MSAIRVTPRHFDGAAKVFEPTSDGLGAIVRGLAIDNARANVSRIVDAIQDICVGVEDVKVNVSVKHKAPKE